MLHTVEFFKNMIQLLRRDDLPIVQHTDDHHGILPLHADHDLLPVHAVLDGVVDQVIKKSRQKVSVRRDDLGRDIALELISQVLVREARIKFLQKLP